MSGLGDLDRIVKHLFDIPETEFLALVKSLEKRRRNPAQADVAKAALKMLYPRLLRDRPKRQPSLSRLFCVPFETLLVDARKGGKTNGKIPRRCVEPIFALVLDAMSEDQRQAIEGEILAGGDPEEFAGPELWAISLETLKNVSDAAAKSGADRKKLAQRLGDDEVYETLQDIVVLLDLAPIIADLKAALGSPPVTIDSGKHIASVREALKASKEIGRQGQVYLTYFLVSVMTSPGEIINLLASVSSADEAADEPPTIDRQVAAMADEVVVGDMEHRLTSIQETLEEAPTATRLAQDVGKTLGHLNTASEAVSRSGGKGMGRRLERVKASFADLVERTVVNESPETRETMVRALDTGNDPLETPSTAQLKDAEDRIVSLRLCQNYAADLGLREAVAKELSTIETRLRKRGSDILGNSGTGDKEKATFAINTTVRMMELTVGSDKAMAYWEEAMERLN